MEPLAQEPTATRLQLSRRKVTIAAVVIVAVAVLVAAVLVVRRNGSPSQSEVAAELKAAIAELTPLSPATGATTSTPTGSGVTTGTASNGGTGTGSGSGSTAGRFDTAALRNRIEGKLDGWNIDLAADSGATRVGAAARKLDGVTCVFAWSDVGTPRSAVVNDPALPCVAEIALIPAKAPA